MDIRLPAHLEVSGLIRMVEASGGFAMVVAKGEREAGTILMLTMKNGGNATLWERMPQLDGTRPFHIAKQQTNENKQEFSDYLSRRKQQDPDIWILELDIADPERFIASYPS